MRTGSAASFIIMMLPPKSGRKAVRLRNASTINKLAQTYTFLMSAWIRTDFERTEQDRREEDPMSADAIAEGQDPANEKQLNNIGGSSLHSKGIDARRFPNEWKGPFRQKMVFVISQLQGVLQQTEMARWEGNLRGHWPHKDYVRLAQVQLEMTACMSQVRRSLSILSSLVIGCNSNIHASSISTTARRRSLEDGRRMACFAPASHQRPQSKFYSRRPHHILTRLSIPTHR